MKTIASRLLGLGVLLPLGLTAQQNLLLNPGFEDGRLSDAPPWGVGGWRGSLRATTEESHSGRRSIRLSGGGDEGGINSIVQIVPVDPTGATRYHFRAWIKIPAATTDAPLNGRTRWLFSDGNGDGFVTEIHDSQWNQIDEGGKDIIPPAGATHMIYRIYALTGNKAAYIDDCELVAEPSGAAPYAGISGTVKDQNGNPVPGAIVFLKGQPKAQEFAANSNLTDSQGKFTLCTGGEDGTYYAVAWKAGYGLSSEQQFTLSKGAALSAFNPVLTKGTGGRNLALSTAARTTAVKVIDIGGLNDPQFLPENVFDGNSLSTRYYNNAKAEPVDDRWIYLDLDPVGKQSFPIREFVLTWLGVTQMSQGWPGLADVAAKDFALEYTTGDPATEANWSSKVAFSVADAPVSFAPVVVHLDSPVTARAVRFHVTAPAGNGFGPTEIEVNSDTLGRTVLSGTVKDAGTGSPIAGARVLAWRPAKIQNDPDIYGVGNPIPYVVAEEPRNGTPYDLPVSKNIEQSFLSDAQGKYTFDVAPGRPIRISVLADGYAFHTVAVTPPADGTASTQDLGLGKTVILSGIVRDASGPVYNAAVQLGGPGSDFAVVTGADGAYSIAAAAGTYELFADAPGHSANTQSVTLSANQTKDITLSIVPETEGLAASFDSNITGWEIARYDTNWTGVGTAVVAVRSTTQNSTPGGSGSALLEDQVLFETDGVTERAVGFQVLQRAPDQRIPVQAGKTYSVYFRVKAENWVTKEHLDAVHYQLVWRDAAGAVVGRVLGDPLWVYPQPFWYLCDRGHPAGTDGSVSLVRLAPPSGAVSLDARIGWLRNATGDNDNNPPGSQLFIDDFVVDASSAAVDGGPVISIQRVAGGQISITWVGTLESSASVNTGWAAVANALSPLVVSPDQAQRFYRAR